MNRIPTFCAIGALAIAAGALAGCGGGSATGATAASNAATTAAVQSTTKSVPSLTISTYKTPEDGTLISGADNRTLYVLTADEKSTSAHEKLSTCYTGCAAVWPPVLASGTPAVVAGKANASLLGLTTRHDGTKQVTYNGLPLYYYAADTKAGQATGNHLKDAFGLWVGMLASGKLAPDGSS